MVLTGQVTLPSVHVRVWILTVNSKLLCFLLGQRQKKKFGQTEKSPKVTLKHLDRPLMVGCITGHKPLLLRYFISDIGWTKNSKYTSNKCLRKMVAVMSCHIEERSSVHVSIKLELFLLCYKNRMKYHESCSRLGWRECGQERHTVAQLPGRYCANSSFKGHQKRNMAKPISSIFWLHFCAVGGIGDKLSISFTVYALSQSLAISCL